MLRRLPISLRFDDEDSDFYFGFIEQKKNDRELSTLILDLLHVYYEDVEVQARVEDYVVRKNPYMQIHEQLERIASEHSRQVMTTSMLGDYNNIAKKKAIQEQQEVDTASEPEQETPNSDAVKLLEAEKRIAELEAKLNKNLENTVSEKFGVVESKLSDQIKASFAEFFERIAEQGGNSGAVQGAKGFTQPISTVQKVDETSKVVERVKPAVQGVESKPSVPISRIPIYDTEDVDDTDDSDEVEPKIFMPQVSKPKVSRTNKATTKETSKEKTPKVEITITEEPKVEAIKVEEPMIEPIEVTPPKVEQPKPKAKKPASFNKLMGSMR